MALLGRQLLKGSVLAHTSTSLQNVFYFLYRNLQTILLSGPRGAKAPMLAFKASIIGKNRGLNGGPVHLRR